jgi:hypothetical protein
MAKYFEYFPKAFYSLDEKQNDVDYVSNIIARFNLSDDFKNNTSVYYDYELRDGDTPEIIAHKFYNSAEKHWIVMAMNDIFDAHFDFPMDYQTFIAYVEDKYKPNAGVGQTGLLWARNNTKEYYKVETQTIRNTGTKTIEKFSIDANAHTNLTVTTNDYTLKDGQQITVDITKSTQSYFQYEEELNESKRKIKLLKPEFVSELEKEFRRVMAS